jgi:hypothetical protein
MLNFCEIKINEKVYEGFIKSGSANSAFERIKLVIKGNSTEIEENLINSKKVHVLLITPKKEEWCFTFNNFDICENQSDFTIEFAPSSIWRN